MNIYPHAPTIWHATEAKEYRDLAAEARRGGRILTSILARHPFGGPDNARVLRFLQDKGDSEATIQRFWDRDIISRDGLRAQAEDHAAMGSPWAPRESAFTRTQAEAMVDWPIYRAAIVATSSSCFMCGHKRVPYAGVGHTGPLLSGCIECDEAAQEGSYAPCITEPNNECWRSECPSGAKSYPHPATTLCDVLDNPAGAGEDVEAFRG